VVEAVDRRAFVQYRSCRTMVAALGGERGGPGVMSDVIFGTRMRRLPFTGLAGVRPGEECALMPGDWCDD
jgi:hypothetical protein